MYAQYNLLESHDTARYLTRAGGDERLLKLTVTFQMTYPGAPAIYYGTEIGLQGGRDPDCRRAMPWDEGHWNRKVLDHYRKLIALRKGYPCLRRGAYTRLYAHAQKGVYAFLRHLTEERIVVILNNSDEPYRVAVPLGDDWAETEILTCLVSGARFTVEGGSLQGPALPARSGAVLLPSIA